MSALLTEEMCQRAWDVIFTAVEQAAHLNVTNKYAGVLVVLDPTLEYAPSLHAKDHYLFMKVIRRMDPKADVYRDIAFAKAQLSWRTGRSSRDIQQNAPHLYQEPVNQDPGDVKWGGSIVREGLVVAFSGVEAVYDEWIAGMMADLLIAMCRHEMTKPDGIMSSDNSFIDRNRDARFAGLLTR